MPQGNVLIVEDDDSIRSLLIDYLKEHGTVTVEGARDGVDALHHVTTKKYAAVILDLMMPYMTGIDFLDSLAAMTSDPSVKNINDLPAVIVITGASVEQVPNSAVQERFPTIVRRVFRKPLDVGELARCVEALMG
ncbi:MAG: response regulator [Acidobacteriota bacterium]|nr:response regulator [Acidobacteriota bacterium]